MTELETLVLDSGAEYRQVTQLLHIGCWVNHLLIHKIMLITLFGHFTNYVLYLCIPF